MMWTGVFFSTIFFSSGMDVNMGRVIQKATAAVVVPLPLSLPRIGSFPRGFLVLWIMGGPYHQLVVILSNVSQWSGDTAIHEYHWISTMFMDDKAV